jgi:hypothetical protein
MANLSPKSNHKIVITETNYPLKSTAPYAPTSEKECISELEYEQYMQDYINTARFFKPCSSKIKAEFEKITK